MLGSDLAGESRIAFGAASMTYIPEIVTLADIPRHHARWSPRAIATIHADRTTTFEALHVRSSRVANGLIALRVKPGARVALLDQNSDRYFEIMLGVAKVGAVAVTVNWRLAPGEAAYVLKDSCAEVLFIGGRHAARLAPLLAGFTMLRHIVLIDGGAGAWPVYEDWIGRYGDADPGFAGAAQDTAVQIYTSGTTGHPKGVELAHSTFYGLSRYRALEDYDPHFGWIDWGPGDTAIIAIPAFHIGGTYWAFLALYCGAQSVILSQFDVREVLFAIPHHRVTNLILVPTMIQQVLAHPDCATTDFSSLRYLLYGASPIPLDLLREATAMFKCPFIQVYGMTELCGAVTYLPAQDHNSGGTERMRSAGKAITGVGLDIRDPEGRSLPRGTVGEICVHSATRMNGYWNLPAATAATMDAAGWMRTGDAGYMDSDGYVYVQDRIKDMIVSGGENVYPAEVESAIYGHPSVAEVAVIGVPDLKWGEAVKAIVVLKPACEADADSILNFARSRIGAFKVPKSVDFVPALPKNATGKVLKRELRKPFWQDRDRQVN
jgi:acyl-CoA synthetase (AMP-forming)/AMP-acid ligase II